MTSWTDDMKTMTPRLPASSRARAASREHRNDPVRLTRSTCSHSSSSRSTSLCGDSMPALLTRRSTTPSSSRVCANARTTSSSLPTSIGTAIARPPLSVIAATISSAAGLSSRWLMATAAPWAASSSAVARPMPVVAPVTSPIRPSSRRASAGCTAKSSTSMPLVLPRRYAAGRMPVFESDAEAHERLGSLLRAIAADSDLGPKARETDAVVQLALRAPDATVTADLRAGRGVRVETGSSKLSPDVVLAMDGDVAPRLWSGELNPLLALAQGQVRTKGSTAKVLRLVPLFVAAAPRYREWVEGGFPEVVEEASAAEEAEARAEAAAPAPEAAPEGEAAPEAEAPAPEGEAPAPEAPTPAADEAPAPEG